MVTEKNHWIISPALLEHPVALILGTGLEVILLIWVSQFVWDIVTSSGFYWRFSYGWPQLWATIGTIDGVPVVVYPGRASLSRLFCSWGNLLVQKHAHPPGHGQYCQVQQVLFLETQAGLSNLLLIRLTSLEPIRLQVRRPSMSRPHLWIWMMPSPCHLRTAHDVDDLKLSSTRCFAGLLGPALKLCRGCYAS